MAEHDLNKLKQAEDILSDIYHEVCYWDKEYFGDLEEKIGFALSETRMAIEIIEEFKEEGIL
jgi:hypothetical protein